jgi:hypothetical protein
MKIKLKKFLEIAKKNLVSVICIVVVAAAITATFWPIGGMLTNLQALADGRASIYSQLQSLDTQARQLPLTDPSKTTQDSLTIFPNEKTYEEGKRVTDSVSKQSMKMVQIVDALNANGHQPLVDRVLPIALSTTDKFHFGDVYKLALSTDPTVSIKTDSKLKDANQPNLRNDILIGGLPPTGTDITAAQKDLWDNVYQMKVITINGVPKNQTEVQAEYNLASSRLPDSMKTDIATKKKIYVDLAAFAINDSVIGVREPTPTDIWFSQLTLWIQQDVANAIAQTNANAKNILDAPVKHLMKLTIPMSPSPYTGAILNTGAAPAAPVPVDNDASQPLTKNLTFSPTGRVSNPMYDVVQFTLVIRVDASQIPNFIQTLGQDRLIDVYNINQVSVDSIDAKSQGYIYGPLPVVQLTLNCEALFMRQWTYPLMPDAIRKLLNIAPPPTAQASAQ